MPNAVLRRPLIALFAVALLASPLAADNFILFQLTQMLVYAVAILGLNLLTGFNGQISLGHGAFFAVGAYVAAILMDRWDAAYYWTPLAAGVLCFGLGFLFGLPALRLEGGYLALATFALAIAMPQVLKFSPFEPVTGGAQGIVIFKPDPPPFVPLDADQWLYCFVLAVTAAMTWAALNLLDSRSGRAMTAIRDNPIAASAMGVNVALVKATAFGVSAFYTGVAGALSAVVVQFVAPDSFTMALSISLLVGGVVGGIASVPGAFIGAAFIFFVHGAAEHVSKGLSGAIYGGLLLLVVFVMPGGVWGSLKMLAAWRPSADRT